ncbi:LacI family transcriptional regulator [Capsulimonas corticalis]|uniref:LacI family transcriptional regulator n=1 Tax=Capsulimonas corticalis TaxID=2219043 RepID=A0A402D2U0_9BACT|nr:LacI family DNA-binding transcriptional regulator [Capsulimonas corticalis]BDI28458.1 LacI family transcriptional regulator [Capsulimonas corticalis]
MATITDVARASGVSVATVSYVINNGPKNVLPETRERVLKAVEALGYRPNLLARGLVRRRTDMIGLLIYHLSSPFFATVAATVEAQGHDVGLHTIVDGERRFRTDGKHQGKLSAWPLDGALIWADTGEDLSGYLGEAASRLPIVYIGHDRADADCVAIDFYDGAQQALTHLASRGRRRIGFLTTQTPAQLAANTEGRTRAYRDHCAATGAEPWIAHVAETPSLRDAGLAVGAEVAALPPDQRPDALFCYNDLVAVGVFRGLRRAGIRVPEDIAVVGFDGIEEGRFLDTPLTTVRSPVGDLCHEALTLLQKRIAEHDGTPEQHVLKAVLTVGGTS